MPYNANIPQPNDKLSRSQTDILGNFTELNNAWIIDHAVFNIADHGKHNKITFVQQGAAPAPGATELNAYNLVNATTGLNEIYIKRNAGNPIPMTAKRGVENGWTYLPSGILLKWGTFYAGAPETLAGHQTVNFPVGAVYPAFTILYNVSITSFNMSVADSNSFTRLSTLNGAALPFSNPLCFYVYNSNRAGVAAATSGFTYFAIGV